VFHQRLADLEAGIKQQGKRALRQTALAHGMEDQPPDHLARAGVRRMGLHDDRTAGRKG
jgi:hypothetical protein